MYLETVFGRDQHFVMFSCEPVTIYYAHINFKLLDNYYSKFDFIELQILFFDKGMKLKIHVVVKKVIHLHKR